MKSKKHLFDALKGTDYSYIIGDTSEETFGTFSTMTIVVEEHEVAIVIATDTPNTLIRVVVSSELPGTIEDAMHMVTGKTLPGKMILPSAASADGVRISMTFYDVE